MGITKLHLSEKIRNIYSDVEGIPCQGQKRCLFDIQICGAPRKKNQLQIEGYWIKIMYQEIFVQKTHEVFFDMHFFDVHFRSCVSQQSQYRCFQLEFSFSSNRFFFKLSISNNFSFHCQHGSPSLFFLIFWQYLVVLRHCSQFGAQETCGVWDHTLVCRVCRVCVLAFGAVFPAHYGDFQINLEWC